MTKRDKLEVTHVMQLLTVARENIAESSGVDPNTTDYHLSNDHLNITRLNMALVSLYKLIGEPT